LKIAELLSTKNPREKTEIKWDEKDVKKSFDTIKSALKKLIADFNSMKSKSIDPLNKKIDAIERALPNKNDILKDFKRDIEDSKQYIKMAHQAQLEEKLKPEKLKIAIKDIMEATLKEKDSELRKLENLVSQTSEIRKERNKYLEQLQRNEVTINDHKEDDKKKLNRIDNLNTDINDLKSEVIRLKKQINEASSSEHSKREKYQDIYNKINEPEKISKIVDMLNKLSSLKELKSRYSSSGDLFDFERKFAVLIGRLVLENQFKEDQDIITVIDGVNKHLDTYEILHPRLGDHQAIDYDIERTISGQNDPGLFINEYITLCVKNKTINTADSIIKALVDAS
jgi:chromosome segregation ATPase